MITVLLSSTGNVYLLLHFSESEIGRQAVEVRGFVLANLAIEFISKQYPVLSVVQLIVVAIPNFYRGSWMNAINAYIQKINVSPKKLTIYEPLNPSFQVIDLHLLHATSVAGKLFSITRTILNRRAGVCVGFGGGFICRGAYLCATATPRQGLYKDHTFEASIGRGKYRLGNSSADQFPFAAMIASAWSFGQIVHRR